MPWLMHKLLPIFVWLFDIMGIFGSCKQCNINRYLFIIWEAAEKVFHKRIASQRHTDTLAKLLISENALNINAAWFCQEHIDVVERNQGTLKKIWSFAKHLLLIDDSNIHVIGEYNFSIDHNLMCFENQTLKDIKEVHSHPMALLQCKEYFNDYSHISLVEATDTAKVAQLISKKKLKGIAAIASKEAAITYNPVSYTHLTLPTTPYV